MTVQLQGVAAMASALLTRRRETWGESSGGDRRPACAPRTWTAIGFAHTADDIRTGGDLASELAYGNHRSAAKYGEEAIAEEVADFALGRAIVFPVTRAKDIVGLRISPLEVVEEEEKLRVIHDLTI